MDRSSDIVERLRAPAYWISGSSEGHEGDNSAPLEAATEIERLRAALRAARVAVEDWASYASDFYREKWDLQGDLAHIDAALAQEKPND